MQNDAIVRARIPAKLKADCDKVLTKEGVTHSDVIRLVYQEIARRKALPFKVETIMTVLDAAE